jgi:hypothetical protein
VNVCNRILFNRQIIVLVYFMRKTESSLDKQAVEGGLLGTVFNCFEKHKKHTEEVPYFIYVQLLRLRLNLPLTINKC